MPVRKIVCLLLVASIYGAASPAVFAQSAIRMLPNRVRAPSLDARGDWINTNGPLQLADLKGKFVILDFWTYCCINCMHILPELKKLEDQYPDTLVVIGVHTPKFFTERDTENVREAVVREKIVHPVFNDPQRTLWNRYDVSVWPSLRVIDPEGYVVAVHTGETTFRELDRMMRSLVPKYRRRGVLDEQPLKFALEVEQRPETPLRYPGKVLADEASNRLFIADTYHNRIVVTSLDGQLQRIIGSGDAGRADGEFAKASFDHPQGMALQGNTLFIADTENHLIRAADLQTGRVSTVAGTGVQRKRQEVRGTARPRGTMLASPWDLLIVGDQMYIAMAGSHQIWRMSMDGSRIGPYAGNGSEDIVDGPRLPRQAYQPGSSEFAQPSGLGTDGTWVFVADSEGSSIRAVPLDPKKEVVTVTGTAKLAKNRLFTYGDRDGDLKSAMLQHPVGLTHHNGKLYIADTYNDKVRSLDLRRGRIATVVGESAVDRARGGDPQSEPDPSKQTLNEPSGVSVAGERLYIADTNGHRIRVVDLQNPAATIQTLPIEGLKPPVLSAPKWTPLADAKKIAFEPVAVQAKDGQITVRCKVELPFGYKWNEAADFDCRVDDGAETTYSVQSIPPAKEFAIQTRIGSGGQVRVVLTYYYCREGNDSVCRIGEVHWSGQVRIDNSGEPQLSLQHTLSTQLGG